MENQRSNQKLHLKYDIFSLIGRNICFPVNLILCCKKIHFIKQFFCKQTIPENHGPEMTIKTNVEKSEQLNSKIIYCNSPGNLFCKTLLSLIFLFFDNFLSTIFATVNIFLIDINRFLPSFL